MSTRKKLRNRLLEVLMMMVICAREITAIADDLAFRQNIDTTEKEIEKIIGLIQQFDPPGVGARDLQECFYYN